MARVPAIQGRDFCEKDSQLISMPSRIANWSDDVESVPPCKYLDPKDPTRILCVVTSRPRQHEPFVKVSLTKKSEESYDPTEGPSRNRGVSKKDTKRKDNVTAESVFKMRQDGLMLRQIAEKVGCSRYTIRNRLREFQRKHPLTPALEML